MRLRDELDMRELGDECEMLNALPREESNARSVELVARLAQDRRYELARRAIAVLFMDQPERIEAWYELASASGQYIDVFALKAIIEEGCAGKRQPGPEVLSEAQALIEELDTLPRPRGKKKEDEEPSGLARAVEG